MQEREKGRKKKREMRNREKKQKTKYKVGDLSPTILIIKLNVNGTNTPINRLAESIENMTQLYAVYKKHTSNI